MIEDDREFTDETKAAIKRAREDIRKGGVYTTKQLIRALKV